MDINQTTCDLSNGDVTILTSQTDQVQYAIDNSTYQTSNYFGLLAPGAHTIYTINRNECILTRDFTIQPSYLPLPLTTQTDNPCNGDMVGQIVLTAPNVSNPYTYLWSTGATSSTISNLGDGTYEVTVTDSDACTNIFSYQIISPSALEMDLVGSFISCADRGTGEININATGGVGPYSFSNDGGANYKVDNFFFNVSPGQYSIQVRDANSCITEAVINIEEHSIYDDIQLDIGNDTCVSSIGSVSIENIVNGSPPFRYSINGINYQSTPQYNSLSYGDYTLYIQDDNGCIWEEGFQVDSILSLHIEASVYNTTCEEENGRLDISASSAYGNLYFLNDSLTGTDSLITELSAGKYKLLVTNTYGCEDSLDLQITEGLLPQPTNVIVNNDCYDGLDGSISLINPFLSSSYFYEWSSGEKSSSISNLGIGDYAVTITDTDNCESYLDFEIVSPPPISLDISGTFYNCPDSNNGKINISASGGFGDLLYSVDGGTSYFADSIFSDLTSTSYLVSIQDEYLCTKDTLIEILDYTFTDDINLTIAMDTCVASKGSVIVKNVTKNVVPYQYSLNGKAFSSDTSFFDLTYGIYTLNIEDGNGCIWNKSFDIDSVYSLHINATVIEDTRCNEENGIIRVDANSNFNNIYFLNDYVSEDSYIEGLSANAYNIISRNEFGCSDSTTLTVLPSKGPKIEQLNVEHYSCRNNNNNIISRVSSGNPPFSYILDDNLPQPNNTFNNLDSGSHTLKVIDTENCITEFEFYVEYFDPIEVIYDFENPSCDQSNGRVSFDLRGGAGPLTVIYKGNDYAANDLISGIDKGTHTFEVLDTTDCNESVTIEFDMECRFYIPTIFTPDDDGVNDTFEIFFSTGSKPIITEFSVYDRWGELVTQKLNVNPFEESLSWDGTFNNQKGLSGVYTYILSGQFKSGEPIYNQGTFVLVR